MVEKVSMMNPGMDGRGSIMMRARNTMSQVLITDQVMEGKMTMMSMDQGREGKVRTRRKTQNTVLVTDAERPTLSMNQGMEEKVSMKRTLVMDEKQTLMNMDQDIEKKVSTRRKARNTALVDMGRRQTMERKRTVGMEGNQLVMGVQTTRQQRVKGTGHHLRGLVMEGLRKRTTENPAMEGVTMMMKAMVARNIRVMMTLRRMRTRRRNNVVGITTVAKTLTIEQNASTTCTTDSCLSRSYSK
uniref:Putative ovule protein n=1 Tax=Solanum chacoense TaxID=4108 RepID=A0A0V0HMY0_SOLCH